ncbi:L,D-transpeptidase [Actinoalloteichus hymeniacidonis]|uniref:L,D-TPase catalytic domain-containing protein n=1 Tax=Actinoalloteichus hymeniacidonis TaxID=340345 RepID=A0AAC9MWY4_9PSEU|nr:Ig-like domain-containing protein [Actinoalloteichus hymeniacidonis]AOS61292.1 hypothetical protein TL08_02270 [Actinoalloteichus hymeniacidonis]MBB5910704.1 lipoprotein-anchoring transpeptidase ErfK/SrfK [Actinoalloteichus hymeniacidonis]
MRASGVPRESMASRRAAMPTRTPMMLLGAILLLLAGCSGGDSGSASAGGGLAGTPSAPSPSFSLEPGDGDAEVNPASDIAVSAADGTLHDIVLTDPDGTEVAGELNAEQTRWESSEPLGYAATYTWGGRVEGADGETVEVGGSFDTLTPDSQPRATINPVDDATVGVAMPVSVKFPEQPIPDEAKAAVEERLTVDTSVPVEGSWAWLGDNQVDWRPKDYWPADTEVAVRADLYGLDYGGGAFGKADLTTDFTIGRNQVVKLDTRSHRMIVERDGVQTADYPASYGEDDNPDLATPNGTFMVMTKEEVGNFSNPDYGYTDVEKKWALRFSNHGEFIHENEENRDNIGSANTSHGCVNLFEADAKDYFDSALIGDPIEITGSGTTLPPQYDVYDWQIPWEDWVQRSAL